MADDDWAEFPTVAPAKDEWAEFPAVAQQQQQAQPEAEGMVGTAAREVGHGIVPMLGTIVGGALGSPGGLPGMVAGGVGGGMAAQYLQEKALNLLGFDDSHQRAVNAKEHPYAAIAGEAATVLPFFGAGAVPKAARYVGGAVVGGLEGARQLYEGEFDPLRLATQTATGAVLAKPRALTRGIEEQVGGALGRVAVSRPGVSRPGFPAEGAPETPAAREEVQPAGQPGGPKVSVATSEEAVTPQEREVGDAQNAAEGSARDYPAEPRTPEAEPTPAQPDYGARLEQKFPRVRPAEEGVNIAQPDKPIADPSLSAALAGKEVIPAEDLAMLGAPPVRRPPVPDPARQAELSAMTPEERRALVTPLAEPRRYVIENAINTDGPTEVRVIRSGENTALMHEGNLIDVSDMAKRMPMDEVIARNLGDHLDPNRPDVSKVRPAPATGAAPPPAEAVPPRYQEAVDVVRKNDRASTSYVQRQLGVGYNQAASLLERMEKEGVVSAADARGKRQVLAERPQLEGELPPGLQAPYPGLQAMARRVRERGRPTRTEPLRPVTPEAVMGAAEQRATEQGRTLGPTEAMPTATGGGRVPPEPPGGLPGAPPPTPPGAPPPERPPFWQEVMQRPARITEDLKRYFAPQTLGPKARAVADWIRGRTASAEQTNRQVEHMLRQHDPMVSKMTPDEIWNLKDYFERGPEKVAWRPNEAQQAYLNDIDRAGKMWADRIGKLDRAQEMDFRERYLPHMYANEEQLNDFLGRGGARGGVGSLYKRVFEHYADAKAAGVPMLDATPTELFMRYGNTMKKFVADQEILEKGLKSGTFFYAKSPRAVGAAGSPTPQIKNAIPEGYVAAKNAPEKNGMKLYMPAEVAAVYDNFYAAGLGNKPVYQAIRDTKNAYTNLELALNGYHLFTMATEGIFSDMAMALEKAAAGEGGAALRTLARAPLAPYLRAKKGTEVQRGFLDPSARDPITQALVELGGFTPVGRSHAQDVQVGQKTFINSLKNLQPQLEQAIKDMRQDWLDARGNVADQVKMPFKQVGRLIQTVSHPLFEVYIPKLKAGAAYEQMRHWHELNPHIELDSPEATAAARQVVDNIDNRFGEMTTNHLFMNKVIQDMGVASLRSMSWLVGSTKAVGGGSYAIARGAARAGMQRDIDQFRGLFDPRSKNYDMRAAYVPAAAAGIAAISTIYQALAGSHDPPASWRDLYAPRTGGMVPGVGGKGQVEEHMLMPGYHKDVHGWIAHPLTEAYNKLAGPYHLAMEQAQNRDWRNAPIVRPNAGFMQNLSDRFTHVLSRFGPISAQSYVKGTPEGSRIPTVLGIAGFHAPGMDIQAPEALHAAVGKIQEREWKTMAKRANREARERGRAPPYPGYQRGGPVLQKIGQRRYQRGGPVYRLPDSEESSPLARKLGIENIGEAQPYPTPMTDPQFGERHELPSDIEAYRAIGRMVDPEKFAAAIERLPVSENIEDRTSASTPSARIAPMIDSLENVTDQAYRAHKRAEWVARGGVIPPAFNRGGLVLQRVGQRRYQEGSRAASQ